MAAKKHTKTTPRLRWFTQRFEAVQEGLERAGGATEERGAAAFRDERGVWFGLQAAEGVLAESLWGPTLEPSAAEGERYGDEIDAIHPGPALQWIEARTRAALSVFENDDPEEDAREAAVMVACTMARARGETGIWSLMQAIEELAWLVVNGARRSKPPEGFEGVRE